MKLTYLSHSYLPFGVPDVDASIVGPQTVYPVGLSLERVLQIYWRAQDFLLVATGNGSLGGVTQALAVNQNIGPRNVGVGTSSYYLVDGFTPTGPGELVTGMGVRQITTGSGTITSGSSTNTAAEFNLQVNLFYPEIFAPDPVVKCAGKWWPAMSISCATTNTVTLSGGGSRSIDFSCDSFDPSSTTAIGAVTFFGQSVAVHCAALAAGETRTFSGTLSVAAEFS